MNPIGKLEHFGLVVWCMEFSGQVGGKWVALARVTN